MTQKLITWPVWSGELKDSFRMALVDSKTEVQVGGMIALISKDNPSDALIAQPFHLSCVTPRQVSEYFHTFCTKLKDNGIRRIAGWPYKRLADHYCEHYGMKLTGLTSNGPAGKIYHVEKEL